MPVGIGKKNPKLTAHPVCFITNPTMWFNVSCYKNKNKIDVMYVWGFSPLTDLKMSEHDRSKRRRKYIESQQMTGTPMILPTTCIHHKCMISFLTSRYSGFREKGKLMLITPEMRS